MDFMQQDKKLEIEEIVEQKKEEKEIVDEQVKKD
jgi:hypothetical protein